jgi:hypothetical protein
MICLVFVGCSPRLPSTPLPQVETNLGSDFSAEFDRLFLSQEPLRYQDNVAFLNSIETAQLTSADRELVRAKLKAFLSAKTASRPYAPDSQITGVASPMAFLRLQSVRLLSEVGTKRDIDFVQNLGKNLEEEHPIFDEECEKAIEKLKNR